MNANDSKHTEKRKRKIIALDVGDAHCENQKRINLKEDDAKQRGVMQKNWPNYVTEILKLLSSVAGGFEKYIDF